MDIEKKAHGTRQEGTQPMTNEELAELEREARHEMDIFDRPSIRISLRPMDIFDRPSIRTSLRLIEAIATAREAEALRAENARLRSEGQWAIDTLEELNPSNYDHDDACRVNAASVEVILGLRAALEQGEDAILRAERNEP